jgi:hypothetical protein
MITQQDIAEMSEAELAAFANNGPHGFTPVFEADGRFAFYAGLGDRADEPIAARPAYARRPRSLARRRCVRRRSG